MGESAYETYLRLDEIEVDESFNSRKHYNEELVKQLAADMQGRIKNGNRAGNINPLLVRRNDEKKKGAPYFLVGGFTRMRALRTIDNKDTPVEAFVRVGNESPQEAKLLNLTENVLRADLSTYEIAARAKELRDEDDELSTAAIGAAIRKSGKYVANLIRLMEKLAPTLLEAWAANHPAATTDWLNKRAVEDEETQVRKWNEKIGLAVEEEPDEDDEDEDDAEKAPTARRPNVSALEAAMLAVSESAKPPTWKEGAIAALKFAAGFSKTIPAVYNPKKKRRAEADEVEADA